MECCNCCIHPSFFVSFSSLPSAFFFIIIFSSDSHWCISLPLFFGRFPNCVSFWLYYSYFLPPSIRSIDSPPPLHLAKTQKKHIYRKERNNLRKKVNWLWLISMFKTHTLHTDTRTQTNHFTVSHCVFCIVRLLYHFSHFFLIGLLCVTDRRVPSQSVRFLSFYLSPFDISWTRK